jgi:hypothetical protein
MTPAEPELPPPTFTTTTPLGLVMPPQAGGTALPGGMKAPASPSWASLSTPGDPPVLTDRLPGTYCKPGARGSHTTKVEAGESSRK